MNAREPIEPLRSVAREPAGIQPRKEEVEQISGVSIEQIETENEFEDFCESGFNPAAISRRFQPLDELKGKKKSEAKSAEEAEEDLIQETAKAEETATRFQKQNPELNRRILLALRASISNKDSSDEILKKVLDFYPDYTLADEALDFLLETTSEELSQKVQEAKDKLNVAHQREIVAGKNIRLQVQEYSKKGVDTPSNLRTIYRDITGTPKLPTVLFDELSKKFSYEALRNVIKFLLHSLGADLKSKGPSIASAELLRLVEETRILQAILGVYYFFKARMKLVQSQCAKEKISLSLSFDKIAQQFVKLLQERYLSPERVLQLAKALGISEEIIAQIIIFTQMRDATRHTAPRLFNTDQHRQEVLIALMEALEELEKEKEEKEEDEESKKKKKKKERDE